ncbi:DUF2780 domain-containing protein [Cellvibrio sp. NN19]|uniref:DUF2780 domain-containing protein n=1 Tax=Cellvibrio chitinivorans TaxID=3102792 RepID=UPI002B40836E|nr:DUF2780 domain-containing protein [Cellvibrio sp. NN19]
MKKLLSIALVGFISTQAHAQMSLGDTLKAQAKATASAQAESVKTAATSAATTAATTTATAAGDTAATAMALVPMLTEGLGVTETQATGGMGSLLQAAQGLMSGGDYSSLLSAIPNADALLAAAPAVKSAKKNDLLGSALGAAANYSASTKAASQLVSQFSSLGLSPDMISQFTNIAVGYLQNGTMPETADLLNTALMSVLPQ